MPLRLTVTQRAVAVGVAAAGLLIGAFAAGGVRGPDIQTSGLSIQPDYTGDSTVPAGPVRNPPTIAAPAVAAGPAHR